MLFDTGKHETMSEHTPTMLTLTCKCGWTLKVDRTLSPKEQGRLVIAGLREHRRLAEEDQS